MENSNNILKNSRLFRMVMRMVLFITLLTHSFTAYSQVGTVYPVEINAMLTPPYGTCLTDYVGTNRFQCNVLMRDMRATGYKFRILMTLKDMASGRVMFAAQSDQHTITPGMPSYMAETGVFGEFFKPENILSSTAYRDGCMNEGAYNFVFQIVDDRDSRRIPISKECVFPARLDAGGAPFLTSPFTGTNIDCNQTIVNLTWQMPFVTGEQIQYLVEVCPSDEGGTGLQYLNDNIRTNYYYSATTYMPMHVLQKTEMMLRENTTYFWRVSILDKDGNVKRNSSSEIDSFSYCYTKELEPYVPLKEPKVKAINGKLDTVHIDTVKTEDNSTKAYWILDEVRFKYQSYALDVRKKSQDTWTSYYIEIKEGDPEEKNYYGLSNLKYNELYEARMQYLLITDGDTAYAPYSDTITFKVPNPMDTADCGEIMPIKDCDGEKGKILKKYDTLYANGTPVVLDSIIYKAEDSTVISGFGIVAFPIVQNFKLKMKFNEVSVNCYGELVSGQVVSVYNESTGAIVDLNRLFGKGDGGGSQSSNEKPEVTKYDSKDDAAKNMPTGGYAQVGDSIYTKDKDGNLVNVGTPLDIPADKYTNDNGLDDDDVYCIFRNDTKDAPYIGFDADEKNIYRKVASLSDHYQSFSKQAGSDNEYIIPYVASNPGRVVKLSATLEGRLTQEYNMDSVKFIMPLSGGNYLALNAKKENDKFIVDFPGGQNPDTNCDVYAIVKKGDKYVNVGKINIETYAWRKQKVKFVPVVNDYDVNINAVSETLNRIYGRFGITYEVTKDVTFVNDVINSEFLDNFSVSSGTFTKQSDDMKKLQYYFKTERGIEDSTAYIFLLKSAVDYPAIDGDMPQGQICGYIFMHSDNGTLSDGRLVAHELAHGIYRLDHVFEKAYGIPENSTDNLLDYNNGDQLAHFQWELIKNPGFAWVLLESDEENMVLKDVAEVFAKGTFDYAVDKAKKCKASYNSETDDLEYECEDNGLNSELRDWMVHVADAGNKHFENKYDKLVKVLEWVKEISDATEECNNKGSKEDVKQCICDKLVTKGIQDITQGFYDMLDNLSENQQALESIALILANQVGKAREMNEKIKKWDNVGTAKSLKEALDEVIGDLSTFICQCFARNFEESPNLGPKNQTVVSFADTENGKEAKITLRCESRSLSCDNKINTIDLVSTCHDKNEINALKLVDNIKEQEDEIGTEMILQKAGSNEDCIAYESGTYRNRIGCPDCYQKGNDWNNTVSIYCYKKMCDTYYYLRNLPCEIDGKKCAYFLDVTSGCGATGSSMTVCSKDAAPTPKTVTEYDDCSGSDLFKGTASTSEAAKALANEARIKKGECVYGLPKCSKWIKDSNNDKVYHITSSPICGGNNSDDVVDLFTVTLNKAGDPEKGSRVMNNEVAMNNLYKVFSYECGADSMLVEDTIPAHVGKAIMVSADQYFAKYALRIFVKVSYDWGKNRKSFSSVNTNDLNQAFDDLLKNWMKKNVSPNPIDYALDRPSSTGNNPYGPKHLMNILKNSSYYSQLQNNLRANLQAENIKIDFCDLCSTFRNIYRIVALSLAKIPYSYEGVEFMYDNTKRPKENYSSTSEYRYLYDGLFVTTLMENRDAVSEDEDRTSIYYTQAEADEKNKEILNNIENALSVCLATIYDDVHKAASSTMSVNGKSFQYMPNNLSVKSVPNIAVQVDGTSCNK